MTQSPENCRFSSISSRWWWSGALLAGLSLLPGCGRRTADIKIDGSSTVYPISEAVAEDYSRSHGNIRVTVGQSGTGGGMKKFSSGEIDICNASRPIKEVEREACAANGIEFIELEVAFDGLAIVVNPRNDWCDCLTVDQLKEMWRPSSAVQRWSDLDPAWPQEEILLYGPGFDSGTFDYFTEAIVGEEDASRSDYMQSEDDNVLVTGVQEQQYALGYFGFAYYEENQDRLKLVAVDQAGDGTCVKPSVETVRNNTYAPLSRPLYLYVRKDSLRRPAVADFVQYYLDHAAEVATDVGYVPVSDEVDEQNRRELNAALASAAPQ